MKKTLSTLAQKSVRNLNEQAFTLLEVLLSLTALTTIVFFMTPVFQIVLNHNEQQKNLQEMEWEIFLSQIKKEIRICSKAEVISGRLVLTNNNDTIYYEKYNNSIRRRVNSTGHEVVLQNVAAVTFVRHNNAITIIVRDTWDKQYSVLIYSYLQWAQAI